MAASLNLEKRKKQTYLKFLEKQPDAYYTDYEDICPMTHTSHRVGQNLKLCSPIYPDDGNKSRCGSGCVCGAKKNTRKAPNGRVCPYKGSLYYFTR